MRVNYHPSGLGLLFLNLQIYTIIKKSMYDQDSKGISYMAGFFMLIAFTIAGLVMATAISDALWVQATGKSLQTLSETGLDPAHKNVYRLVQVITAVVGYLLPALVTAYLLNRRPMRLLGVTHGFSFPQASLTVIILAASLFVATGFSYITTLIPYPASWIEQFDLMEKRYSDQVSATLSLSNPTDLVLAIIVMAVFPAIGEEVFFRGGLQNFLSRGTGRPWLAIVVTSILFSLAHFSFYGFLSRVVLGITLGALFHYSGRLWISIFAHFLNNALLIVLLYVYMHQGKTVSEMMMESKGNVLGLLAIPVLIVLLATFKKVSAPNRV